VEKEFKSVTEIVSIVAVEAIKAIGDAEVSAQFVSSALPRDSTST
jgi:hypothetical protein